MRMDLSKLTAGDIAWIGIYSYWIGYDIVAFVCGKESMTQSFARALADPRRKWPTRVIGTYIVLHLYEVIPAKLDPLRSIGPAITERRNCA